MVNLWHMCCSTAVSLKVLKGSQDKWNSRWLEVNIQFWHLLAMCLEKLTNFFNCKVNSSLKMITLMLPCIVVRICHWVYKRAAQCSMLNHGK